MKKLNLFILTLTLLLGQMSTLDHVYSEHHESEVCDYCISTPPLDNALSNSTQVNFLAHAAQQHVVLTQASYSTNSLYFYTARAPPRLI